MNIIFIENLQLFKKLTKIKTIGGIETNTNDIIQNFRQKGHNVWILNKEKEPNWAKDGDVNIIAASTFDPITYYQIIKNKKKYSKKAAVVIHAHTTVEDLAGNFVPDTPIFNTIFKYWLKILYGSAHLLITPSEFSKQCLINIQTSMTYPINVVSNGIWIEKFNKNEDYRINFRNYLFQKYNIPRDRKVIINVGLTWKKKGVKTFGYIAKRLPEYFFVWVGPISNNPDINDVSQLPNVFFTGFYDDIREVYYGADLFLNTSFVENQCIPLIESAICRVPIVARDLPVFDWLVHDYSCFKSKNVDEFIRGIIKILTDSSYKEKLIEHAYSDAIKLHDFKNILIKIEGLYNKAIKIKKIWDLKRKN